MKIVPASYEILTQRNDDLYLRHIERVARVCYKSEAKMTESNASAIDLIGKLMANGHEAMIEHSQFSVLFTVDRGVSHEIVRHRIASFAQESTRYCNYADEKFGTELTFIKPFYLEEGSGGWIVWKLAMEQAERSYLSMIRHGHTPQEARAVLPNSLKTDIVVTANYREWRHIFKLRTAKHAHPQMREVMVPLYKEIREVFPFIFEGIGTDWFEDDRRKSDRDNFWTERVKDTMKPLDSEMDIDKTGIGVNRE